MEISATIPVTGFELFGTRDDNQLAGYTGVNIGGKTGIFPKTEDKGWTGIAFVNPGYDKTSVNLTVYDDFGNTISAKELFLDPHEKYVALAPDIFETPINGATYISYSSDYDVVGFQLNGLPGLK